MIDEGVPARSAVILTQTGLPDPLEQALNHRPVFDGRLSVREIQHGWELKAELVTLSACETALGRDAGGEGFVGFTQALLMSGTRSVVLSLWKVDDRATSLLMARFYQNLLGKRPGLSRPMPKAEALREAKQWLRNLTADEVGSELAALDRGPVRRWPRTAAARPREPRPLPGRPACGRTPIPTTGPPSSSWATRIERCESRGLPSDGESSHDRQTPAAVARTTTRPSWWSPRRSLLPLAEWPKSPRRHRAQ